MTDPGASVPEIEWLGPFGYVRDDRGRRRKAYWIAHPDVFARERGARVWKRLASTDDLARRFCEDRVRAVREVR